MHMEAQDPPSLVQALEMLLFCHGRVNLILDQHKMHITLGNRPKNVELDPEYQTSDKLPSLFILLKDNKESLLAKQGIVIKITSGNYYC